MPAHDSTGLSRSAAFVLFIVTAVIVAPLGAFITVVVAQTMGGSSPPRVLVLNSSQAGGGALGKGWGIGGLSSISHCRATREAGDFIGAATPDGNPHPVNFTASDRFCLDGQRLIPASTYCPAVGGATAAALATEVDSFKRVRAYTTNAKPGPAFFTAESKDGAISFYGDRDNATSSNRPDGHVDTTSPLKPGAAIAWAQTRSQDCNYIGVLPTYGTSVSGSGFDTLIGLQECRNKMRSVCGPKPDTATVARSRHASATLVTLPQLRYRQRHLIDLSHN